MNKKWISIVGIFLGLLLLAPGTYAKSNLEGKALGQNFGDIWFDLDSVPFPALTPEEKQALIDVYHPAIFNYGENGCSAGTPFFKCLLTGFAWSDAAGWLVLDGATELSDFLTPEQYAKAHFNYNDLHRFPLTGYIWSEYGGWIKLAADDIDGTTINTIDMCSGGCDNENWGVWMDLTPLYPAGTPNNNGAASLILRGYAWSENLGWIKFDDADELESTLGSISYWIPDVTPPALVATGASWFPTNNIDADVIWDKVVTDPETKLLSENITITADNDNRFTNCIGDSNVPISKNGTLSNNDLNLRIFDVGDVKTAINGYCKYTLSGTVTNELGNSATLNTTFFTRAGTPVINASTLSLADNTAIADGTDEIKYDLAPVDIAGNPIVDINCNTEVNAPAICPGNREVTAEASLENEMAYDTSHRAKFTSLEVSPSKGSPLYVTDQNGAYINNTTDVLSSFKEPVLPLGTYELRMISFAPTQNLNKLTIEEGGFKLRVVDNLTGTTTPYTIAAANPTFSPALVYKEAAFSPATISLSESGILSFKLENKSSTPIMGSAVDTRFRINSGDANTKKAILIDDIYEIGNASASLPQGRTDRVQTLENNTDPDDDEIGGITLFALTSDIGVFDIFHIEESGNVQNLDPAYKFGPENTSGTLSNINNIALAYENGEEEDLTTKDAWGNLLKQKIQIGRYHESSKLNFPSESQNPTKDFFLHFSPKQSGSPDAGSTSIGLTQWVAYKYQNSKVGPQPSVTVYEVAETPTGIGIASLGVEFTGTATGKNIFDLIQERNVDVISAQGLRALREQMRRNVADLTARKKGCDTNAGTLFSGNELTSSGICITKNETNKTIVAFYEDLTPDTNVSTFVLGSNDAPEILDTLYIPKDYRYTLIIKGGDLWVKDNIAFDSSDTKGSLGIILLADENGRGGNLLMSPEPTNMVGSLYAEGSIMSLSNDNKYYYAEAGLAGDVTDLKNQLFWQGTVASLNTIGGAPKGVLPEGVTCDPDILLACARRFDLDYIRRFSVSGGIASGKFSGKGSCSGRVCTFGGLPTTISLESLTEGLIKSEGPGGSLSTDPFFIQRDPRADNNPPLGFSVSSDFKSTEVIR